MFFVNQYASEAFNGEPWRGYYWHQILLGLCLFVDFTFFARLPFLSKANAVIAL